jgi:type II secretory pathway pseudopilin PulG
MCTYFITRHIVRENRNVTAELGRVKVTPKTKKPDLLNKKRRFTIIELLVVVTLMSILMSITFTITAPDRSGNEISNVRSVIQLYQAGAYSDLDGKEYYRVSLSDAGLTIWAVTANATVEVHHNDIDSKVLFDDGSIIKGFKIRRDGTVYDFTGNIPHQFLFKLDKREGEINIFTGRISLGLELVP